MQPRFIQIFVLLLILFNIVLASCSAPPVRAFPDVGQLLKPTLGMDISVDGQVTGTVDPAILASIDAINNMLRELSSKGIGLDDNTLKLGANLVEQIEKFNQNIEDGFLDENMLSLVDRMATVAERGIEVGLDDPTLEILKESAKVIDKQPEKWGRELQVVTQMLGLVGNDVAKNMSEQLSLLSTQISNDVARIQAAVPGTVECTIGAASLAGKRNVQQAAGEFWAMILPSMAEGEELDKLDRMPSVCTILPLNVEVELVDGKQVVDEGTDILEIHGFNFESGVKPDISVRSEDGTKYNISLSPSLETDNVWKVNLGDRDFSEVGPNSIIVIEWTTDFGLLSAQNPLRFEKLLDFNLPPTLTPDFTADQQIGEAPLEITFFEDAKGLPTTWTWNFGDGSEAEIATVPGTPIKHIYEQPGTYTVTLLVDNAFFPVQSISKQSFVTVTYPPPPIADFSISLLQGYVPFQIALAGTSDPAIEKWEWDFGDGVQSELQNPSHKYTSDGTYKVQLTVTDIYGQKSDPVNKTIVALKPPIVIHRNLSLSQDTVLGLPDQELILPDRIRTNGFALTVQGTVIRSQRGNTSIISFNSQRPDTPPDRRVAHWGEAGGYEKPGGNGQNGKTGRDGVNGRSAGRIVIRATSIETNLSIQNVGSNGGHGGAGGVGGNGGRGGKGTNASSSAVDCKRGAGNGRTGGAAGDGGKGGRGGNGGNGGRVDIDASTIVGTIVVDTSGGSRGNRGEGGNAGTPGAGGPGGDKDSPYCRENGNQGDTGSLGSDGRKGSKGSHGEAARITIRKNGQIVSRGNDPIVITSGFKISTVD